MVRFSLCTWNQNPGLHESVIEAIDFEGTLAGQTISRATSFGKLTLKGKNGTPPGGTFRATALMLDGGSPVVRSCKIFGPDVSGAYPQGRSAGIFIAWSSNAFGPYIANNTITGGKAEWADGILMSNRPGQNEIGNADILNNTISGGAGTQGSAAIAFHNSGPNTQITDNDLSAGTSQAAYAFGIEGLGTADIDKNRVNLPGSTAKCNGAGRCGGIVRESCSGTITNNVVFGADASSSSAIHLVEAEKPAGNVVIHSNYLNGAGSSSGSAKSAAISVEIGSCTTCGFKGKTGRIRGNILELGQSPTRCGVVEVAPAGKQMHPEAFEFNFFSSVNAPATPCFYSFYDGPNGEVAVTGWMKAAIDFGGGPLPFVGSDDVFLVRLAANGTHVGSQSWGGLGTDRGLGVAYLGNALALSAVYSPNALIDFGGTLLPNAVGEDGFFGLLLP